MDMREKIELIRKTALQNTPPKDHAAINAAFDVVATVCDDLASVRSSLERIAVAAEKRAG